MPFIPAIRSPRLRHVLAAIPLIVVALMPGQAFAQNRAGDVRLFVGGLGGLTFGTASDIAMAGRAGFRVAPDLFVIVEGGRMRNIIPKDVEEAFNDELTELAAELGVSFSVDIAVPASYGFGGVRWMRAAQYVAPFVEAGLGLGHISFAIRKATVQGIDIKEDLERNLRNDGVQTDETKLLLALGGGVNLLVTERVSLDLGYRFTRIATEDPAINTNMVYAVVNILR